MAPLRISAKLGRLRGFTLVEVMVGLAILGVLAALAFPSVVGLIDKYRLRGAVDILSGDFQFARMESIRNNQPVFISVATGAAWCYGMKLDSACDCTQPSTDPAYCSLKLVNYLEDEGVTLSSQTLPANVSFDPQQGLLSQGGAVVLQSRLLRQAQVELSHLGTVSICTPTGATSAGYPPC